MPARRGPGRPAGPPRGGGPRERLLSSAGALFSSKGIGAVGIDEVLKHAGVARVSLYQHFGGKEGLVAEYLRRKHTEFSAWLEEQTRGETTARGRIGAVFRALRTWHERDDFHGCSFARALGEVGSSSVPIRAAVDEHHAALHAWLRGLAQEAGARDAHAAASGLMLLINGANLCAASGDRGAAERARGLALRLLEG